LPRDLHTDTMREEYMTMGVLSDAERARTGTRITWKVAGANLGLSLLKVLAGYFGHSQAVWQMEYIRRRIL
jgi:hypothetical protein